MSAYNRFNPELSAAEESEFEHLPEEIRGIAEKYFGLRIDEYNSIESRLEDEYERGYQRGLRQGQIEGRNKANEELKTKLGDFIQRMPSTDAETY